MLLSVRLHVAEEVHNTGENNEQDTASGTETQDLGQETLVQGSEALFLCNGADGRPGPVVLGRLTGNLGAVLNSRLDDVHRGVEDRADGTANSTGDQIVGDLAGLGLGLGEKLANLENAAEVAGVPENVTPHGALETVVHGQNTLSLDGLTDNIKHAVVLSGGSLILETDLDELEGYDDERLGSTGASTGQNRQGLVHLVDAEHLAVDLSPLVVGGKLGGTLGSLHENGGGDSTV